MDVKYFLKLYYRQQWESHYVVVKNKNPADRLEVARWSLVRERDTAVKTELANTRSPPRNTINKRKIV